MRVHREEKRGKGNRRGKEQNRKEKGKEEKKGKESKEEEEDNLGGDIDGDDVLHAFKRKHKDRSIATGEPAPSLLPASLRRLPWGAHGRHDDHEEGAPLEPGGAGEVSADSAESGEVTEPWLCLKNPSPVPPDPSGAVFTRT